VTYGVGTGAKSKEILRGISGSLGGSAGAEVCAILGPSGSGKTSLLNILANRVRTKGPATRVGGVVTLDGKRLVGSALRKRIAYVMQQCATRRDPATPFRRTPLTTRCLARGRDLLFATQTPREAMLFSAMLRLPRRLPLSEKKDMVEAMIDELGLTACADTFCGDEMVRGISGGEKKRTAIGIECVGYTTHPFTQQIPSNTPPTPKAHPTRTRSIAHTTSACGRPIERTPNRFIEHTTSAEHTPNQHHRTHYQRLRPLVCTRPPRHVRKRRRGYRALPLLVGLCPGW
jgi:Fe-S cluster assembly ATPase SufC